MRDESIPAVDDPGWIEMEQARSHSEMADTPD
jgi:hypothetical protein